MKLDDFDLSLDEPTLLETPSRGEHMLARFCQQAATRPQAMAVMAQDGRISYGKLATRAAFVAHALAERGVGPGSCVALELEGSVDMVVALLGTLALRACYVPINADWPRARRDLVCEDAEVAYRFGGDDPILVAARDADASELNLAGHSLADLRNDDLVYIMYTSGSTGRPKGVMVAQRSILRLVIEPDYVELGPSTRILQTGSLAFDASTFEIWGALLNGGAVCFGPRAELLDAQALGRRVRSEAIDTMFLTTALFNQLCRTDIEVFAGLRWLLTGGEEANPECFRRVRQRWPKLALVHVYGPTENTTFTSTHRVGDTPSDEVPIGRAIRGTTLQLLDARGEPTPKGEIGELCTGGQGLAWGYFRHPGRSAAAFVPDPSTSGGRLYRTGDLARENAAGDLVFCGRRDQQVKIRGYRIEPGEVLRVLERVDGVETAFVMPRDGASAQGRELWAFVCGDRCPSHADIRSALAELLPDYMVPAHFVTLEALPFNANGKVDTRALERLLRERGRSTGKVQSMSELESRVHGAWCKVLGHANIAIDDDFFACGGHSLALVELRQTLGEWVERRPSLLSLMQYRSIRSQAAEMARAQSLQRAMAEDDCVQLNTGSAPAYLFAFPPGAGYSLVYSAMAQLLPERAFYGFNFIESEDAQQALAGYATRVLEIAEGRPVALLGYSGGGKMAHAVARVLEARGTSPEAIIMLDAPRYLSAVQLDEVELESNIARFSSELDAGPERRAAEQKMRSYHRYITSLVESDAVAAPIFQLCAERGRDQVRDRSGNVIADRRAWSDLTRSGFVAQMGRGPHDAMLEWPHVQANALAVARWLDHPEPVA